MYHPTRLSLTTHHTNTHRESVREADRQTYNATPLVTTWTEPFYVLVSDGLAGRKGHMAHTVCVV